MIARLAETLRAIRAAPVVVLEGAFGQRLRADCADALRLQLDCMQQTLSLSDRAVLRRLLDALEDETPNAQAVVSAARAAAAVLDVADSQLA